MKKFILFTLGIFLLGFGYSASVDLTTAEQVAKAYFKVHNYSSKPSVSLTYTKYSDNGIPVFYVYNLNPTGFVIVSADDAVQPILAYSLESSFRSENMSENIEWWLNGYKSQIQYVIENNISASSETAAEWQRLLSLQPETSNGAKAVAALCSTKWDQMGYSCTLYNDLTPSPGTSNSSTPTGCVATAMAQIMKYWGHPSTGVGSNSYSSSTVGGTLSANFATTTYNWANMPNTLSCSSSSAQKTAVATIMYHCGVAVNMDYSSNGSGALTNNYGSSSQKSADNALKNYFKYKSTLNSVYRDYKNGYSASGYPSGGSYTETEWKNLLKAELDGGRPILYSGTGDEGGHAFVCDGYDDSDKFHFNWGWSGSNDGYYTVNNLAPGSGGAGGGSYEFNSNQRAVIGIEPIPQTAPDADFIASTTTVMEGSSVTFTDISANFPTSWSWSFPGGTPSTSNAQNPTVTYNTVGTYNVTLTASNTMGSNSETKTAYITVVSPNDIFCDYINQFQGTETYYEWTENHGYISGTSDFACSYVAEKFPSNPLYNQIKGARIYLSAVTATNPNTNINIVMWNVNNDKPGTILATKTITLQQVLNAYNSTGYIEVDFDDNISIPTTGFCLGIGIPSSSNGSICVTTNTVGDTETNTGFFYDMDNVWYSYTNYPGSALSNKIYASACHQTSLAPTADFSATPTLQWQDQVVNFTDESYGATVTSWQWTFEGGTPATSNLQNPSVTWTTPGTYDVTLTVSNANGSNTITKTDYITIISSGEVHCDIDEGNLVGASLWGTANGYVSGTNEYGFSEYAEYFDARQGYLEEAYFWFYVAKKGSAANVNVNFKVYAASDANTAPITSNVLATGTATLASIVADNGNQGNYTHITFSPAVNVTSQAFYIAFDIPTTAAQGDTLAIVHSGNATTNTTWTVYQGSYYSIESLFAEPLNLAIFPVICQHPVEADFEADALNVAAGETVHFSDLSAYGPTEWSWTFEGGTPATSTLQNPSVVYDTPGTYTVTLLASNALSSDIETKTAYITVTNAPETIVLWSFPTSSSASDGGIPENIGNRNISKVGSTTTITYDNRTGATKVARATAWNNANLTNQLRYWLVSFTSEGYQNLKLSFDQMSKNGTGYNTGAPRNFKVQYSLDNSTWTDIPNLEYSLTAQNTWESKNNYQLPTACENQSLVYLRWIVRNTTSFSGTVGANGQSSIDNIKVTGLILPPTAEFTAQTTNLCITSPEVSFTDQSTGVITSWLWNFGDGTTSTEQNPTHSYTAAGNYSVSLSVSNDGGSDTETKTNYITITNPTTPTFNIAQTSYCQGNSIPTLPTTSTNGISGTWTPAINNNATTTYTFTPTAGQCATTATVTITVNPIVTPTFNIAQTSYCQGSVIPALPTTSTNGISGTWTPAINNNTTTTYTFTPTAGQCATTATVVITITTPTTPTFTIAQTTYCQGSSIPALPTTSTNGISGTWSPAINNNTTTTYTFTPTAGQCATTATVTITITNPTTPTFTIAQTTYCQGSSIPSLPTTSTNGIIGTWSPAINNNVTTTYTFTPTAGQCATTATVTITVNPTVTPTFNIAQTSYCQGSVIPALPTTSTNGISGTWTPAINNNTTTTYTFTPTAGQCATTATVVITITTPTTPTFTIAQTSYCQGSSIPALPTTSTNGISGTWTPAINNNTTTTYTFTPTAGQCATTATVTITITNPTTPTFTIAQTTYCQGSSIPSLPTTSTNGISGTWSPAINNNATTTYTFTPTAGQCATTATQVITINQAPVAPVATIDCLGIDNGSITVVSPLGANYQYSLSGGAFQTNPTFAGLQNNNYTITVKDEYSCETTGTYINLNCGCENPPTITLTNTSGNTNSDTPFTLSGNTFTNASDITITHNGTGTLTSTNTTVSPFEFTYTPTIADENNVVTITFVANPLSNLCIEYIANFYLTVNELPTAATAILATENSICENTSTTLSYQGGTGDQFVWYEDACGETQIGTGNNFVVTPTQTTNYFGRWENAYGNSDCLSITITVNENPTISVSDATACDSYTLPTSENSDTWEWANENNETVTDVTESGVYTVLATNEFGCTATENITVTINQSVTNEITETACGLFEWNGTTYDASGDYDQTFTAENGCDSIVTLHLTINEIVTNEITETACGSFEWNGTTYTETGDYTETFTAENGCDSIVTLHLTINEIVTNEITEIACGSFEWNGTTYDVSGDYTETFTAENGCDSVVTLHLTINELPTVEITQEGEILTASAGMETYAWNTNETTESITISATGNYSVTVTNAAGCESTADIEVTEIPTTGINEIAVSKIAVYPNPNNGEFTINLSGIDNAISYQVIDAKGAIVKEAKVNSNEEFVSIQAKAGNYTVKVISDSKVFVEQIIVQ